MKEINLNLEFEKIIKRLEKENKQKIEKFYFEYTPKNIISKSFTISWCTK